MKRHLWHPSKRRLRGWLDEGDDKIDAHLDTCARCAAKLEDLSQPTTPLADALRAMLEPPADLQDALRVGIERKIEARADMELLAELMGIPWRTAQAVAMEPPDPPEGRVGA